MTSYPEPLTAKKIDEDEFYAIKIYHISSLDHTIIDTHQKPFWAGRTLLILTLCTFHFHRKEKRIKRMTMRKVSFNEL
jgi:hypothetical protein